MKTNNIKIILFSAIFLLSIFSCGDEKTNSGTDPNGVIDDSLSDTLTDTTSDTLGDTSSDTIVIGANIIANHTVIEDFELIPDTIISAVTSNYRILYGHTSHGSQIMSGLTMLYVEDTKYVRPTFHEVGDDLGANGDTSWVPITRNWLNSNPTYNMVIWSWCGGVSISNETEINVYLNAMNQLEIDYPNVLFVYMTGHLDGSGENGNLRTRNRQIRQYCLDNEKILFDFEDIESYDPDGTYYPDETDACGWCGDWCATHTCPTCSTCAHSHCFNCYLKAKAFWWMLAALKLSA